MRAYSPDDAGVTTSLYRGMANPAAAPTPQKTITPVAPPAQITAPAPAPAPASLPGMTWDEYSKNISNMGQGGASGWNNKDVTNGFEALGKQFGYNGPVQQLTGGQHYDGEGESGPMYSQEWGPAAGLTEALKNYRFADSKDASGNGAMQVYDSAGNPIGGDRRIASSGGSMMKAAGVVIPALVGAGFGAGALGAMGYGPMAAEAAGAGAADAGTAGLGEFAQFNPAEVGGFQNVGAAASEGTAGELAAQQGIQQAALPSMESVIGSEAALPGLEMGAGADAATSAAWSTGAAGLGGDTISAMKPAGVTDIASALTAAKSGLGSVTDFAKANPQLAALGASGAATLLNGTGGNPPAAPGSGSATSGGASNDALIQALTDKLYGADGSMSKSFDYSSVPGLKTSAGEVGQFNQSASDAAYNNATRYLDPQIAQQQAALEARLAEQGFVPGTPGYKQAMGNFQDTNQRAYAAARDTATLQGFSQGNNQFNQSLSNANLNNSASREQLAQLLAERNQPLNELNALKTGQQLTYENQLGQYNADVASKNSTNQALSQLALALGIYLG